MKQFKVSDRYTHRSDGIQRYLNEVQSIPMISAEEESEIATLAKEGDEAAKEKLILSNLRFVISVAKMYSGYDPSKFEDLINEGNKGLIEAAESFDPSTGFKFISYAVWHIRKYMTQYMSKYARHIRVPQNKVNAISKMKQLDSELSHKLGREATEDEVISAYLDSYRKETGGNMKIEELKMAITADLKTAALDLPSDGEGDAMSPLEYIDGTEFEVDSNISSQTNRELILKCIRSLNPIDQEIILTRFGFKDGAEFTSWKNIGDKYGLAGETVRTRYRKAIRTLKMKLVNNGITSDIFI